MEEEKDRERKEAEAKDLENTKQFKDAFERIKQVVSKRQLAGQRDICPRRHLPPGTYLRNPLFDFKFFLHGLFLCMYLKDSQVWLKLCEKIFRTLFSAL